MRGLRWIIAVGLFIAALPFIIPGLIMAAVAANFLWDFTTTLITLYIEDAR